MNSLVGQAWTKYDHRGRAGVEWGVTGVPETFVVDGDGTIIYKLTGPITADNLREELLPAIDGADPDASREASANSPAATL